MCYFIALAILAACLAIVFFHQEKLERKLWIMQKELQLQARMICRLDGKVDGPNYSSPDHIMVFLIHFDVDLAGLENSSDDQSY